MKKLFLVSIITVLAVSCGENNKNTQSEAENQPEIKTVSMETVVYEPAELQAEFKDPLMASVYKDYNLIKSGLVNSDAGKAQKAAKTLLENNDQLKSDEMKKAAGTIAETSDLKKQREAFQTMTAEMIALVEGNLASGKLYYQYCPMAFSGEGGFWLSNSEKIMNPYYGDAMLNCGEVRKVIE